MKRAASGLTLIEVLIAAVMIFSVVTVVSEGYRASLLASRKSTELEVLLAPLPLILNRVRSDLRDGATKGRDEFQNEGTVLSVDYRYTAKSESFKPPVSGYDFATDQIRDYAPRYYLFGVVLTLKFGSTERSFEYRELAWLPELE